MRVTILALLALLAAGCANPYAQFYQANPGTENIREMPTYDSSVTGVSIFTASDFNADTKVLMRQGYFPIGSASFNAGEDLLTRENLLSQASKVGAHAVLIKSEFSHTVSGAIPLVVPQNSTTYTSGTASAYGPGGSVTAYGNATSTTYGSQTVMMPYSVRRFDAAAVFFVKRRFRLGILPKPLSDEVRKARGSNQGVQIDVVVEGSPAYRASLFEDDVVLSIDSTKLFSMDDFAKAIDESGGSVKIEFARNGKVRVVTVQLAEFPSVPPKSN